MRPLEYIEDAIGKLYSEAFSLINAASNPTIIYEAVLDDFCELWQNEELENIILRDTNLRALLLVIWSADELQIHVSKEFANAKLANTEFCKMLEALSHYVDLHEAIINGALFWMDILTGSAPAAPDDGATQEPAPGISCHPSTRANPCGAAYNLADLERALAEIEPADISLPVENWVFAKDILNKATKAGYFTPTPQKYVWKAAHLPDNVLAYLCLCLYYKGTDTDIKIIEKPLPRGTGKAFALYFDNVPELATAIKNTKTALAHKKELSPHQLSIKKLFI